MYFGWKPYVPAAARRQTAERTVAKMKKEGQTLSPVAASRGAIAKSFWGKAWCRNLERYRTTRTVCHAAALTCATAL